MTPLRVLDLFSGIGGFSLGLERTGGFKTVAFCEIEPFPRRVLAKHWPGVPIHEDVRKLKGEDVGAIDVICGGYPCQPFSLAGKRAGAEDDRHLWPEMRRLVDELRPAWVIGENVAGHISMGLDDVLSDLECRGYACRTFAIPALALGAPHQRFRVWTVGHADRCGKPDGAINDEASRLSRVAVANAAGGRNGRDGEGPIEVPHPVCPPVANAPRLQPGRQDERPIGERVGAGGEPISLAHAELNRCQQMVEPVVGGAEREGPADTLDDPGLTGGWGWWESEPDVGRVAHGVPSRVDRLRGLGNAVVPQIPEIIGRAILQAEGRA